MTVSKNIERYISDSLINGKVCRFNTYNNIINIYISKIVSKEISDIQKETYYSLVQKACLTWNKYNIVNFVIQNTPQNAHIVINWTKAGRIYEGMCKFRSIINSEIRSVTIEIGLPNNLSPKNITDATIFHSILHELGHAAGLGHGTEENDIMYVPHTQTLSIPSENDIFVLKKIYSVPNGTTYINIKKEAF